MCKQSFKHVFYLISFMHTYIVRAKTPVICFRAFNKSLIIYQNLLLDIKCCTTLTLYSHTNSYQIIIIPKPNM